MGPNWGHMGWAGMGWSWILAVLLIVGIVLLIVLLARGGAGRDPRQTPPQQVLPQGELNGARQVLDERYARGEIDTAEYDERRQRLDRDPGT